LVTDDDSIAERLKLIRNHGEVVVGERGDEDLTNMIGYNFRLGEIECAIGIEQLKKLKGFVEGRQAVAEALTKGLNGLEGLTTPVVGDQRTHVYYVYPLQLDAAVTGVSRDRICDALSAEGVSVSRRYQNIHLLPMYQKRQAYGTKGFPWSSNICHREVSYEKGICPVAEKMNDELYIGLGLCVYDLDIEDVGMIVAAFEKVWSNLDSLR